MAGSSKKKSPLKTPANRSAKAHVPLPERSTMPGGDTEQQPAAERQSGQFSGQGIAPSEKK